MIFEFKIIINEFKYYLIFFLSFEFKITHEKMFKSIIRVLKYMILIIIIYVKIVILF